MYDLDHKRRLVLNGDALAALNTVNRLGNQLEWSYSDQTWGIEQRWPLTNDLSHCDGVALWKMHELLKQGFPQTPLLFTICITETGGRHAVLCVLTDEPDDYVLDCRFDEIKTYQELRDLGYQMVYRSSLGGSLSDVVAKLKELQ